MSLQQFLLQTHPLSFITALCPHPPNPGESVLQMALKEAELLTRAVKSRHRWKENSHSYHLQGQPEKRVIGSTLCHCSEVALTHPVMEQCKKSLALLVQRRCATESMVSRQALFLGYRETSMFF